MNQNKGYTPIIICSCLAAVVYLVVALLVPFLHTPSFWVAFGTGWFSIIVAIATNTYVVKASNTAKGVLYRSSLSVVSIGYLIVSFVLTLCFMAVALVPIWIVVVVQVVLAAICVAILVAGAHAATHIESGEARTQQDTMFMMGMRAQVESLVPLTVTPEAKRAVSSLSEALRYTDPVTNPALYAFDQEIAQDVAALRDAIMAQNEAQIVALCTRTDMVIKQRAAIAVSTKQ